MGTQGLGTETANVMSSLMVNSLQPVPEVGMGITECGWTDRHAGTIIKVSPSRKTLWYQLDRAIRVDNNGMSDCQEWRFERFPEAPVWKAVLTKRGWKRVRGVRLLVGQRCHFYDFSF